MTGYFRDDGPLYDLILDERGRREFDRLWQEFDFAASVPQRMHTSFVWFERTDSGFMRDPEFDPYRPEDKSVTSQEKIGSSRKSISRKPGVTMQAKQCSRRSRSILGECRRTFCASSSNASPPSQRI